MSFLILSDVRYRQCLSFAQRSRSRLERFGALLDTGKSFAPGWNSIIGSDARIRQGYANHAEIAALDVAYRAGLSQEFPDSTLYVAGFFPRDGFLDIREGAVYTCRKCLPYLERASVGRIAVPTLDGWASMTLAQARASADAFMRAPTEERYRRTLARRFDGLTIDALAR